MHPSYYVSVDLLKTSVEFARDAYLAWAVGAEPFAKLQSKRATEGIDTAWSLDELRAGTSMFGLHDARIATRRTADGFLLALVHRDARDPAILWHNVAELRRAGSGVRLRHATARTAPPRYTMPPIAGAPRVVSWLLSQNGPDLSPVELAGAETIKVSADVAEDVVAHLIATQTRSIPVVVVTTRVQDGSYLANPLTLAQRLSGLARVVQTADLNADKSLLLALTKRGFPGMFGVSDGAVRLFLPQLSTHDSPFRHRLWTRARLEGSGSSAAEVLAGEIAEAAVRGILPAGFLWTVERYDLTESRARLERVLAEVPQSSASTVTARLHAEHERLRAELALAAMQVSELSEKLREEREANYREVLDIDSLENERDQLKESLFQEQAKSTALKDALAALKGAPNGDAMSDDDRSAILAVLRRTPTPLQCLLALKALYPARVVVLQPAIDAASSASDFRYGHQLWELLHSLVTDYWEQMRSGGAGDAVAGKVFGAKFAKKESETTMNNKKARDVRTFLYRNKPYTMWRHLRHGVADTTVESIRVHFDWLADESLVLIGHCGAHLYLPLQ